MQLEAKQILLVGCGDIGGQLAVQLLSAGARVFGLRRNIKALPDGVEAIAADITDADSLTCLKTLRFDYVVVTTTAGTFSDERYRAVYVDGLQNVLNALGNRPKRLFLVSSTSVYGQGDGEWVDESSTTCPRGFSGKRQLEAEQLALNSAMPTTVVRFGGIYGPGRSRLIEQVARGELIPESPLVYGNRIHRDDCVGVLAFLIKAAARGETLQDYYLAVDCDPAPLREVHEWLARQLGLDPKTLSKGTVTTQATEGKRTARGSKRCSNQRLLDSGFQFTMKSYRDGYPAIIAAYLNSTPP